MYHICNTRQEEILICVKAEARTVARCLQRLVNTQFGHDVSENLGPQSISQRLWSESPIFGGSGLPSKSRTKEDVAYDTASPEKHPLAQL